MYKTKYTHILFVILSVIISLFLFSFADNLNSVNSGQQKKCSNFPDGFTVYDLNVGTEISQDLPNTPMSLGKNTFVKIIPPYYNCQSPGSYYYWVMQAPDGSKREGYTFNTDANRDIKPTPVTHTQVDTTYMEIRDINYLFDRAGEYTLTLNLICRDVNNISVTARFNIIEGNGTVDIWDPEAVTMSVNGKTLNTLSRNDTINVRKSSKITMKPPKDKFKTKNKNFTYHWTLTVANKESIEGKSKLSVSKLSPGFYTLKWHKKYNGTKCSNDYIIYIKVKE
jgi:hypothetical protein